jgi:hypothetical protein
MLRYAPRHVLCSISSSLYFLQPPSDERNSSGTSDLCTASLKPTISVIAAARLANAVNDVEGSQQGRVQRWCSSAGQGHGAQPAADSTCCRREQQTCLAFTRLRRPAARASSRPGSSPTRYACSCAADSRQLGLSQHTPALVSSYSTVLAIFPALS